MLIKVEHLRKEYDNVTPIKDINCEIKKGEVISIIGPSGTGKSTFINCINGLEKPTSGKIIFDGIDITDEKCDMNAIRKRIGMVFQSFNLFSHLTVIENAMLAPVELLHLDRQVAYDKCMDLLASVGLKDKAYAYPSELSGGQQQRAAIVRAIAMDPEVILFDEPTSALDPTMIGEVQSTIQKLADMGFTMLIVTHEMKFAHDIATRVFYLDEGTIYEEGTPNEIFENPKKDKTMQFVKRLKVFRYHISSTGFDFLAMMSSIEEFAYKNLLSKDIVLKLQSIAEELCVMTIIPNLKNEVDVDYSFTCIGDGNINIKVTYNGEKINYIEEDETMATKILKGNMDNINYNYDDSTNKNIITAHLKMDTIKKNI